MNNDKKALRYAARLTCIYDLARGGADRLPEDMSKDKCLEAIGKLSAFASNEEVDNLWKQASRLFVGIGNKDIQAVKEWYLPEVVRVYNMQRREVAAVNILKRVYEKDGRDLFEISRECNVYCWTLQGWLTLQKQISWKMVKSLEKLEAFGKDYTIMDAFRGMQEVYKNADPSGVKETAESDSPGA